MRRAMRRIWNAGLALIGGLLVTGGCQTVDPPLGVCGNGIVEPANDEDCDGAAGCVAADAPHSCMWSCEDEACPDGVSCGLDGVCRRAGVHFTAGDTVGSSSVVWAQAADMDADGRDDLVVLAVGDLDDVAELTVHFFDSGREVRAQWRWSGLEAPPLIQDVDEDGLLDLVVVLSALNGSPPGGAQAGAQGLQVLRNTGDRSFRGETAADRWAAREPPELFATLPASGEGWDRPVVGQPGGLYAIEAQGDELVVPGAVPLVAINRHPPPTPSCAANPRIAVQRVQDPFPVVETWSACTGDWTLEAEVEMQADDVVAVSGLTFDDVNDDGMVDLVAGIRQDFGFRFTVAVAHGRTDGSFHSEPMGAPSDGQFNLADAALWTCDVSSWPGGQGFPTKLLAYGDIDGDGVNDFVLDSAIALSSGADCTGCTCGSSHECLVSDGSREAAVIADLDGDGDLDIVAIAHDGGEGTVVEVLRGSASGLVRHVFPTPGRVALDLVTGDFDGDTQPDVAVRLRATTESGDAVLLLRGGADLHEGQLLEVPELLAPLAVERYEGALGGEDRLLAIVGSDASSGVARFILDREERLVSPVRSRTGELVRLAAGQFDGETLEIAAAALDPAIERMGLVRTPEGIWRRQDRPSDGPWSTSSSSVPTTDWFRRSDARVADVDEDGADELVVVGPLAMGSHIATWDAGSGGWSPGSVETHPGVSPTGSGADASWGSQLVLDDLDDDGHLDLIVMGTALQPSVGSAAWVALGDGTGVFDTPRLIAGGPERTALEAFVLLDRSTEGSWRLVAVVDGAIRTGLLDPVNGSLELWPAIGSAPGASAAVAGDLDGDGLLDAAIQTAAGLVIVWGEPTFVPSPSAETTWGWGTY